MITIDFESYWDTATNYSLSKITTEEYIRDQRFEVTGVAVMIDDNPAQFFSGDFTSTYEWLRQFPWADHAVASHNAMFDMGILCWRFGLYPKMFVDTMSMARALHGVEQSCSLAALAKRYGLPDKGDSVLRSDGVPRVNMTPSFLHEYGDYCKHDTYLCRELYKRMKPYLPTEEMMAIHETIKWYAKPMLMLDSQQINLALTEYYNTKRDLLNKLNLSNTALRSDDLLADLLMDFGVVPPMKASSKQKNADGSPKMMWAFARSDTEFMDLLDHDDPIIATLVEARLATKTSIVETRLISLDGISRRGTMPYPLSYGSAQPTLRWQAYKQQKINVQNFPRAKPGQRSPLRDAICAPPGYKLGVIDLSQIELRVNCWQSGQSDTLALLESGGDAYANQATQIYGYVVNKKTHPVERFVGKTAELGCGYQCGGEKFTYMLRVAARRDGIKMADESVEFGTRCVQSYRASKTYIVKFWRDAQSALEIMAAGGNTQLGPYEIKNGMVRMPDGMWMYYPNLRWYADAETGKEGLVYDKYMGRGVAKKWIYGGLFTENLSQRVARGVMRDGMLRLALRYHVVGSVHDELLFLIPESEPDEPAMEYAVACLTQRPVWAPEMPLAAEGGIGKRYGDAK